MYAFREAPTVLSCVVLCSTQYNTQCIKTLNTIIHIELVTVLNAVLSIVLGTAVGLVVRSVLNAVLNTWLCCTWSTGNLSTILVDRSVNYENLSTRGGGASGAGALLFAKKNFSTGKPVDSPRLA